MGTPRDLGRIELWEESLQRSLARRGKLKRTSPELYRLRPERDLSSVDIFEESWAYSRARRQAVARRSGVPVPVVGLGGVSAAALLSVTVLPSILAGRGRAGAQQVAFAASGLKIDRMPQPRPGRPLRPPSYRLQPRRVTSAPVTTQAVVQTAPATPAPTHSAVPVRCLVAHHTRRKPPHLIVHRAVHPAAKPTDERETAAGRMKPADKRTALHLAAARAKLKAVHREATPKPEPRHHASKSSASQPHRSKPIGHHSPAAEPRSDDAAAPRRHRHHSRRPKHRGGYVNPLAHASVTPERIDMGVDYAGTGRLTSIGRARVTYAATSGTGWPGAFIEYQLLDGPDAGRYVYYAEGVRPAGGISVGRIVQAGHAVAYLIPGWSTGIEIGWGAGIGTETLAAKLGEATYPTAAGERFSALVASLGGPPGVG